MTLHYLFTLLNLPIGTSRHDMTQITLQILPEINIRVQYIKYTSEYILKLKLHQHLVCLAMHILILYINRISSSVLGHQMKI